MAVFTGDREHAREVSGCQPLAFIDAIVNGTPGRRADAFFASGKAIPVFYNVAVRPRLPHDQNRFVRTGDASSCCARRIQRWMGAGVRNAFGAGSMSERGERPIPVGALGDKLVGGLASGERKQRARRLDRARRSIHEVRPLLGVRNAKRDADGKNRECEPAAEDPTPTEPHHTRPEDKRRDHKRLDRSPSQIPGRNEDNHCVPCRHPKDPFLIGHWLPLPFSRVAAADSLEHSTDFRAAPQVSRATGVQATLATPV